MPRTTIATYTQPIYVAATERSFVDNRIHKATDYGILSILCAMLGGESLMSPPAKAPCKNRIVRFTLRCDDTFFTIVEQQQSLPETLPTLSERDMAILAAALDCGFEYRLTPYADDEFADTLAEWESNHPIGNLNRYTLSLQIDIMER